MNTVHSWSVTKDAAVKHAGKDTDLLGMSTWDIIKSDKTRTYVHDWSRNN